MSNKPRFAKRKGSLMETMYDRMVARHSGEFEHRCNVYTCKVCKQKVKTVDEDNGVTPMFITCQCGGTMASAMYNDIMPDERPTKGWYRPSFAEYRKLDKYEQEHVLKGGLLIRDIRFV